jgi:hypothetical protein|uniref:Uncharacterized protein n=1 Tax=virus sp. ctQ5V6 TaxID=2825815 RepID=A0A8S5RQN2_9VIRU|nr:MAG TPA: hypothetical protein [virus sp. ctQ5V6]
MKKENKEILRTYRRLLREFDKSETYTEWIKRRCKVLAEAPLCVSARTFHKLVKSICL